MQFMYTDQNSQEEEADRLRMAHFAFSQVVLIGKLSAQISCALIVLKKWAKEKLKTREILKKCCYRRQTMCWALLLKCWALKEF